VRYARGGLSGRARVCKIPSASESHPDEVRIAFDGDAVLFSDEAERVYQSAVYRPSKSTNAARASPAAGPDAPFLCAALAAEKLTSRLPMRIRTALVTGAARRRTIAVRTLMSWDIEVDEAMFLGGLTRPVLAGVRAGLLFRRPAEPRAVSVPSWSKRARRCRDRQSDAPLAAT
jgi:5'-nucleotidase